MGNFSKLHRRKIMWEEEKNPNSSIHPLPNLPPDLVEEIIFRLPLKSILKCRTLSKQWKSILESKRFIERRMTRKILAAYHCDCGTRPRLLLEESKKFEGDEEIVYLHCDTTQPSMTCEGRLVCFPEQDWINVLNPSTGQLRRFPSGLNTNLKFRFGFGLWSKLTFFPDKWVMGFGRDKVTRSYKVVRMCFSYWEFGQRDPVAECGVLDVKTGEWRKLRPPPRVINARSKSVCVDGSIYWLHIGGKYRILALDLHKETFFNVPVPDIPVTWATEIVNLKDRLTLAKTIIGHEWLLEIWSMDTLGKKWSKTYSISLANRVVSSDGWRRWFTPVAVSKQGNVIFHDNQRRLFKYYPRKNEIRCLSLDTCVISTYLENLVPLPLKPSHEHPQPVTLDLKDRISRCRLFSSESSSWMFKLLEPNDFRILDFIFAFLVVAGYILSPH